MSAEPGVLNAAKKLVAQSEELLVGASEMRSNMPALEASAGPADLVEALAAARRVMDSLEGSLTSLMQIHLMARHLLDLVRGDLEDAEMDAVRTVRHGEYVSARERQLTLKMSAIEEVQKERSAARSERVVYSRLEIMRILYRGAENDRRDLDSRLRALTLITNLERG